MEKTVLNCFRRHIYNIFLLVCLFSSFTLVADHQCNCEFCELEFDLEEPINYEELGEYEDLFREFEEKIEEEEAELDVEGGLFRKWKKKIKRWFKKRVVKLIKSFIDLKKIRNADDCAYTVARFKRKVDKIHKTGSIEKLFEKFDEEIPEDPRFASFDRFKKRIKYYYNNKKAKPPSKKSFHIEISDIDYKKPDYDGELDNIPTRALIGGVEIACGSLISILPFPGCQWLGYSLIGHGVSQIYEGYMQEYEDGQGAYFDSYQSNI